MHVVKYTHQQLRTLSPKDQRQQHNTMNHDGNTEKQSFEDRRKCISHFITLPSAILSVIPVVKRIQYISEIDSIRHDAFLNESLFVVSRYRGNHDQWIPSPFELSTKPSIDETQPRRLGGRFD